MWLHLVQVLESAVDRYLLGTSVIETDLLESAHIFHVTLSECLHLRFKVACAPSSLARIH